MKSVQILNSLDKLKIIADPRRLAILRSLMAKPATLSQLGRGIGEHPAWVRHHLKRLEAAGLVKMGDVQVSGGFVEKFYQATARAFILQQTLLPEDPEKNTLILLGSHDLGLELLAEQLNRTSDGLQLLVLPVGSLEGLVSLRQGITHLTGCHLFDAETGDYNSPYVRRFFPDRPILLLALAQREQGLMVAPGNPLGIRGLDDLARPEIALVHRNQGSGTRVWLNLQLAQLGLNTLTVNGYAQAVPTHTAVAQAVASRSADVGLGLRAAAARLGLDFIPLFEERYDLVIPKELSEQRPLSLLIDQLESSAFRQAIRSLPGYQAEHTGECTSMH